MTSRRRGLRTLTTAGVSALVLAGCAVGSGDDPATVTVTASPDGSSDGSTSGSATSSQDLGTLTGAGRPLTEDELEQALPDPSEVQEGWEQDPARTVGEVQAAQVSPSTCAPLLQKGPGWDETKATQRARVQANYRAPDNPPPPGSVRHFMGIWAYSFDDPYPVSLFDEAGARVAECAEFEVTQADTGNSSSYEARPLTFPNLGDRTLALRLEVDQTFETVTMDFVVIKVGHNTFAVANTTYNGQPDTDRTERAAKAVLENLEKDG